MVQSIFDVPTRCSLRGRTLKSTWKQFHGLLYAAEAPINV